MRRPLLAAVLGLAAGAAHAQDTEFPPPKNPQQPPALPADPLKLGETPEKPLLSEEINLVPDLPAEARPGAAPRTSPRYRLQLATEAMEPVLPPLETNLDGSLAGAVHIPVKKFVFQGNRIFTDRQLARRLAPYTGRTISSEELEEARVELTKMYVEAGYIASGAVLPDQDVDQGVIKFQLVEGRLTEVEVRGNFWFRKWWLRQQLRRAAGTPVSFTRLKMGIQLLRQNPTISRINAEVKPGTKPGESRLEFSVKDEQPFRLSFELSNKRPPSVSEGLGEVALTDLNLTGHNDPLEVRWGLVRWTKSGAVEFAGVDNVSGSYEFPVTPWDTTLAVRAGRSDSSIVDETFAELGITSLSEEVGVALRQPLYQTLTNTVTLSAGAEREHSETFLLGRPFTLSAGSVNGESNVFVTRFGFEWVNRSQRHVLAFRTSFNFGLYALGSTRADPRHAALATSGLGGTPGFDPEIPDSKFFSWLGQAQYVWRPFDTAALRQEPAATRWALLRETVLVLRANAQFSDEPLLPLEQFSIGGLQSVRGYRENQLLRDDGVFASVELRVPLWLTKEKTPLVALAPFFDFGAGWDINKVDDNEQTIYSAGLGLLINATKHAQLTVYWGHPFVDFHERKQSFQDYGFHFALAISAF